MSYFCVMCLFETDDEAEAYEHDCMKRPADTPKVSRCDMETCPMWDGLGCPCETFGLDRDDLPRDGVFTVEIREGRSADTVGGAGS